MAKDGSALGVTVTRGALLTHCRSLTTACHYKEGEYSGCIVLANISVHVVWIVLCLCDIYIYFLFLGEVVVCTEDPKKSIGLWHGIMAVSCLSLFSLLLLLLLSSPSLSFLPPLSTQYLFILYLLFTHRLPIMVYMLYLCLQVSCRPFLRSGST